MSSAFYGDCSGLDLGEAVNRQAAEDAKLPESEREICSDRSLGLLINFNLPLRRQDARRVIRTR